MERRNLYVDDVVRNIRTVMSGEKPTCITVETNEADEVINFRLKIKEFNPYAPYAHQSNIGRAIKTLEQLGLVYTNDDFSIVFYLRTDGDEKYFSSAVGGWNYSYREVSEILSHFKSVWKVAPKLVNMKEGEFLKELDKDGSIKTIWRVGVVNSCDYTIFDIQNQTESGHLLPTSISKKSVNFSDKSKMIPISREAVEARIKPIQKSKIVQDLLAVRLVVGNLKKEELPNYWATLNIGELLNAYERICCNRQMSLFRVYDGEVKIYDPIGNFVFWGHTKKILS